VRLRPALPALPLLCSVLLACSPSAAPTAGDEHHDGYPVTVSNCGRDVTLAAPPQRIVSLNQGSTEVLLALGVGDRVVGTAGWTDPIRPDLAAANARVDRLADTAPSLEAVLDKAPDLVTASLQGTLGPGGITTSEDLEKLGVASYMSAVECTKEADGDSDGKRSETLQVDKVYTEIDDLGGLVGRRDQAQTIVADMRARMARATATATGHASVLYWFANSELPYVAGCCGGPGIITRTLGLTNAFADAQEDWPQVGWETVAQRNPDVLVLGDLTRKSQTAENAAAKIAFLESNPVTREMTAVQNKHYVLLAGAELNPSIRIVDAVEKVAAGLRQFGLAH
jgi:iron complex transport system substrate-binding protein